MLLGTFSGRSCRSVCYGEKKVRLKKKSVKLSSGIIQKMKKQNKVVLFFSECNVQCLAAEFNLVDY